jgi:HD-GYP domain-containing protein (c-di-GMP phosphodiesterase class II)
MGSSERILQAREETHGRYAAVAATAQELKNCFATQANWIRLSPVQRESLDLIATKLARILNGDPDTIDHWADVAGYARLVARELALQPQLPVSRDTSEGACD